MSLGGFKFAGRYCEKGSLGNSEWCLRIALYVGWDPSNPDITQASAWSLYDDT